MVVFLLERGADVNAQAKANGWTLHQIAAHKQHNDVATILRDHAANPRSLQDICRLAICKTINQDQEKIKRLPVPNPLKNYVAYN